MFYYRTLIKLEVSKLEVSKHSFTVTLTLNISNVYFLLLGKFEVIEIENKRIKIFKVKLFGNFELFFQNNSNSEENTSDQLVTIIFI